MENDKKISVKDRILIYCKLANISTEKIADSIGVSSGIFRPSGKKSSISSASTVIFLTTYPEVSAEWLLRGEGPMLRQNVEGVTVGDVTNHAENNSTASIVLNLERQNAELLRSKDETIAALREVIDMQRTQIDGLKNKN